MNEISMESLPEWERDLLALQAQQHEQFTGWMSKQGYVDPLGQLAEAFEAGWADGAAHVASPAAEDFDRAAQESARRSAPELGVRYALIEQLGHRSMVGITRDITYCGKTMLEVQRIDVIPSVTVRVNPDTFYDVTDLSPEQAVAMARAYGRSTGGLDAAGIVTRAVSEHRQLTAADDDRAHYGGSDFDRWGVSESDDDRDDRDEGRDEGRDDGMTASEPHAAGEPREAEADPWFGPAGAPAAAPVSRIEAEARRAAGWPEDQPQQQAPANGTGPQPAQRQM